MDPTTWDLPFPAVAAVLFGIVLLRSNATYWLGRGLAAGAKLSRFQRLLDAPGYRRAASWLNRWGAPAVSVSFLTVGAQTLVNLAAGATRMPLARYVPANVVGCVAWALLYATVGTVSLTVLGRLYAYSPSLAIALLVDVVGLLAWWIAAQVRAARAGTKDLPGDETSED